MKIVPIFFTFDNNFVIPAIVAFYSLLSKAKIKSETINKNIFYKMHVLHSDITEENQNLIKKTLSTFSNFELEFKNVKGFMVEEWNNGSWGGQNKGENRSKFTADTILRCFPVKFFPQYDKIIYSDVDVVFADDISELIDIDLEDKYIAAVKDISLKCSKDRFNYLDKKYRKNFLENYFAGGIWVLNNKKIKEDNLEKRIFEIIKDDSIDKKGNDQDIMNIACDNKVKYLPLNYIGYPYIEEYISKPDFESHFSFDEMYDSIINPKIIHYASVKPWNGITNYSENWWTIYRYLEKKYDLKKTKIFEKKYSISKMRRKNIISGLLLICQSLPILSRFFNKKNRQKLYKSIEKYKDV